MTQISLLTTREAAQRLGVSPQTLGRLGRTGDLETVRHEGRLMFLESSVEAYLRRHGRTGAVEAGARRVEAAAEAVREPALTLAGGTSAGAESDLDEAAAGEDALAGVATLSRAEWEASWSDLEGWLDRLEAAVSTSALAVEHPVPPARREPPLRPLPEPAVAVARDVPDRPASPGSAEPGAALETPTTTYPELEAAGAAGPAGPDRVAPGPAVEEAEEEVKEAPAIVTPTAAETEGPAQSEAPSQTATAPAPAAAWEPVPEPASAAGWEPAPGPASAAAWEPAPQPAAEPARQVAPAPTAESAWQAAPEPAAAAPSEPVPSAASAGQAAPEPEPDRAAEHPPAAAAEAPPEPAPVAAGAAAAPRTPSRQAVVAVSPISRFSLLREISESLRRLPGVAELRLESLEAGLASYRVLFDDRPDDAEVAAALVHLNLQVVIVDSE